MRNMEFLFPSYAPKILDAIPSGQRNNKTSNIKLNKATYIDFKKWLYLFFCDIALLISQKYIKFLDHI